MSIAKHNRDEKVLRHNKGIGGCLHLDSVRMVHSIVGHPSLQGIPPCIGILKTFKNFRKH